MISLRFSGITATQLAELTHFADASALDLSDSEARRTLRWLKITEAVPSVKKDGLGGEETVFDLVVEVEERIRRRAGSPPEDTPLPWLVRVFGILNLFGADKPEVLNAMAALPDADPPIKGGFSLKMRRRLPPDTSGIKLTKRPKPE